MKLTNIVFGVGWTAWGLYLFFEACFHNKPTPQWSYVSIISAMIFFATA